MSHVQSTVRVPSEGNTFHPITSEDLSRCSGQTSHYIVEELNESGRQTSERRISTLGAKTAQLYSDLLHDVQWEPFTAQNSQHGVRLQSCIQTYSMMYSGNRSQLRIPSWEGGGVFNFCVRGLQSKLILSNYTKIPPV